MNGPAWSAALDDFAGCLAEQERLLDEAAYDRVPAFSPPEGLGPLPDVLRPRALELAARSEELVQRAQHALTATGRQTRLTRRLSGTPTAARPLYLDRSA